MRELWGGAMKNAHTSYENVSARTAQFYYPCPKTQTGRLIAALIAGEQIDPLTGWRKLGIYRLASTVHILRGAGWSIVNTGLTVKNRFGDECDVALYELPHSVIGQAGGIGQLYAEWVGMVGLKSAKCQRLS